MATTVYPAMVPKTNLWIKWFNPHTEACGPRQCMKGDPKDTVATCQHVSYVDSMATATCVPIKAQKLNPHTEACGPRQCVKGDPKDTMPEPYHEPLREASHAVLQVQQQDSPGPKRFSVNVYNGFNGKKASVTVRSTDTIGKLQQRILKLNPDLIRDLNLVFNGKPVELHQTLSELQVKPGATFITFMRCNGG